jgi:hypothetical protein
MLAPSMTDYISEATKPPVISIPANRDEKLLKATLGRLAKWDTAYPRFADETSLLATLEHATTKPLLEKVRDFARFDPRLSISFLRNLPEKHWKATNEYEPATFAMALARSIQDKRCEKTLRCTAPLVHATDDELRTMLAAATKGKAVDEVKLDDNAIVQRLVPLFANAEQLVALWKKVKHTGKWRLLRALDDAMFMHVYRNNPRKPPYSDGMLAFEALRRGLLDDKLLDAELNAVAQEAPYDRVERLFAPPHHGSEFDEVTTAEALAAMVAAYRHAQPHRARLRAWFDTERANQSGAGDLHHRGTLLVFCVAYDESLGTWFADQCNADKEWFRKSYQASWMSDALGDMLITRDDGEQILAAIGKRLKGKTLADVVAQARARLANHRVIVNPSTPAEIQWGRTDCDDALRMLHGFSDPRPAVEAGISSDDPVAVLNAFVTAFAFSATYRDNIPPDQRKARELWSFEFLARALRALERLYTPSAPDGKALHKRIGGWHKAGYRFEPALRWLSWLEGDDEAERERFVDTVLAPLYASTDNVKFKRWIEPLVTQLRPALAEPTRDRLVRLATQTAADTDETTKRTFVFRTDAAPTATMVNRLFGPPIGVDSKTWPKHGKKPMQHLITLETRLLSPSVAAAYAKAGTQAIAVFVSSLDKHEAFKPRTKHAVIVPLSAKDIARGAEVIDDDDRTKAGVALDAVTCELPDAVFKGGAKQGALWELRRTLDQTDFVSLDRTSPNWIQDPQPAGVFLFELDENFAGELNLGDAGRFYVFDATAFMQCH